MWSFRISYCRSLPVNIHVKFQFGFRFGLWCCLGWVLILFCGGGQVFESKGGRILFFSWAQVEYGYIYIYYFFWGGVRGSRSAYWFHPCSKPNWANSSWPTWILLLYVTQTQNLPANLTQNLCYKTWAFCPNLTHKHTLLTSPLGSQPRKQKQIPSLLNSKTPPSHSNPTKQNSPPQLFLISNIFLSKKTK